MYTNFLLKTIDGVGKRPDLDIFVVWSALIVGGWVVLAWGRRSCLRPAAIASCVFLVSFNGGDAGSVKDFIFLFLV